MAVLSSDTMEETRRERVMLEAAGAAMWRLRVAAYSLATVAGAGTVGIAAAKPLLPLLPVAADDLMAIMPRASSMETAQPARMALTCADGTLLLCSFEVDNFAAYGGGRERGTTAPPSNGAGADTPAYVPPVPVPAKAGGAPPPTTSTGSADADAPPIILAVHALSPARRTLPMPLDHAAGAAADGAGAGAGGGKGAAAAPEGPPGLSCISWVGSTPLDEALVAATSRGDAVHARHAHVRRG